MPDPALLERYLRRPEEELWIILGAQEVAVDEGAGATFVLRARDPELAESLAAEGLIPRDIEISVSELADRGRAAFRQMLEERGDALRERVCPLYVEATRRRTIADVAAPALLEAVTYALSGTGWAALAALVAALLVRYGLDRLCAEWEPAQ